MKSSSVSLAALIAALVTGCGFLPGGAMPGGNTATNAGQVSVTGEQKDAVRKQEAEAERMEAQMGNMEVEQIDRMEKDLVKALKFALGQQAAMPNMPPPETSSTVVKALRKANIKLRIEAVTDQDGQAVADNFLQVKDSFTDRVQMLSRKMAEQTATPAEKAEIMAGSKHVMKLNDIKQQLLNVSMVTMQSNSLMQTGSLTTMMRAAGMVRTRKQMEMQLNEADYARVARWLERQRRIEAIAATSMGILATYQAVLNNNGNPAALDALASNALKAFPLQTTVSSEEAKGYVTNLEVNVAQVKRSYEDMMRKVHGDTKYERKYKAGIDALFRNAETASSQKSVSEMAADTNTKYNDDLAKCGRGEAISPGSLVSPPKCKDARQAVLRGEPLPIPGAQAQANTSESSGGGGLLGGLMGSVGASIPGLSIIKGSLDGLQALMKGDAKGALNAAMTMVPGGAMLKKGVEVATNVVDAVGRSKDGMSAVREGLSLAQKLLG